MGSMRVLRAIERPSLKRLSVRAKGVTLIWEPKFQSAMRELCRDRGLVDGLPEYVHSAVLDSQGIMLVWPAVAGDPQGSPVRISARGRRVQTDLPEAFAALHVYLPYGIAIGIPVTRYLSPRHGQCLALHFHHAEFLYRRSRPSAIGLQRDDA